MKKIYNYLLPVLLVPLMMTATAFGQKSILFIGAGATESEYASDQDLKDSIASWGYTVEYIDDNTFTTTAPTWSNYMGVFINETVGSGNIKEFGALRDNYPVPCVAFEGWAPNSDRWGWLSTSTDDYKEASAGTTDEFILVVKNNTHYITREYNIGDEITWSVNENASDISNIKLRAIKEVNITFTFKLGKSKSLEAEDDYWAMVAIDSQAAVPNRVFWWGLNQWGLNGSENTNHYGTNDLFKLLKRGCDWAYQGLEKGVSGINDNVYEAISGLEVYPNPATEAVILNFNADEPAYARISICTLTGQEIGILTDQQIARGNNSLRLNVEKFPAGAYIIQVKAGEKTGFTKLLIH